MTILSTTFAVGLAAFLVSGLLTPALGRWATRWALVDHPGGRKLHGRSIPSTGGVALFWAVLLPLAAVAAFGLVARDGPWALSASLFPGEASLLLTVLFGAIVLHATGIVDDRRGLGVPTKLVAQSVAVIPLVALQGMVLLPLWLPPWLGVVGTLVWFLAVINAFNFLDGLDGLLGGVAIVCASELAAIAALGGQWSTALLLTGLIGALAGFLVFNLPPARIFAGDSGSLVVGFLLAFASVRITYHDPGVSLDAPPHAVLAPVVIMSLPLYDLASVLWLRFREGRSPFVGDTSHLSHRLLRRGLTPRQALVVICASALATGLGGIVLMYVTWAQALIVALQAVAVLTTLALLEWASRPAPRG